MAIHTRTNYVCVYDYSTTHGFFLFRRYVSITTASLVSIRLFVFCLTEHATAITGVQTGAIILNVYVRFSFSG